MNWARARVNFWQLLNWLCNDFQTWRSWQAVPNISWEPLLNVISFAHELAWWIFSCWWKNILFFKLWWFIKIFRRFIDFKVLYYFRRISVDRLKLADFIWVCRKLGPSIIRQWKLRRSLSFIISNPFHYLGRGVWWNIHRLITHYTSLRFLQCFAFQ